MDCQSGLPRAKAADRRNTVAERVTYYAVVNDYSSRERPGGVIRRIVNDERRDDQAFTRSQEWQHTGTLYSWERGNGDQQLYEISETEANRIVDRIRRGA
jgi:hypothetical protein